MSMKFALAGLVVGLCFQGLRTQHLASAATPLGGQGVTPGAATEPAQTKSPKLSPGTLPNPLSLADGKRVRIRKLDDGIEPLEIIVPPTFKLKIERNEELNPVAHLLGEGLDIRIGEPEAGTVSFANEKIILRNAEVRPVFIHEASTKEGYLLVYQNQLSGDHPLYNAVVSRPSLKVDCWVTALEKLSEAERAASVCLTLDGASHKPKN